MTADEGFQRWPTFAGNLCASHIGAIVTVDGYHGILREVRHSDRFATVAVLLRDARGKQQHVVLDPHDVLERRVSLHSP